VNGFTKWLNNVIANSSSLSKLYVSIAQTVTVCLSTHTWTGLPSIASYVANALVYLVPNAAVVKTAQAVAPSVQELAAAIVSLLKTPAPAATPTAAQMAAAPVVHNPPSGIGGSAAGGSGPVVSISGGAGTGQPSASTTQFPNVAS
jgi:hypothetical protein